MSTYEFIVEKRKKKSSKINPFYSNKLKSANTNVGEEKKIQNTESDINSKNFISKASSSNLTKQRSINSEESEKIIFRKFSEKSNTVDFRGKGTLKEDMSRQESPKSKLSFPQKKGDQEISELGWSKRKSIKKSNYINFFQNRSGTKNSKKTESDVMREDSLSAKTFSKMNFDHKSHSHVKKDSSYWKLSSRLNLNFKEEKFLPFFKKYEKKRRRGSEKKGKKIDFIGKSKVFKEDVGILKKRDGAMLISCSEKTIKSKCGSHKKSIHVELNGDVQGESSCKTDR